MQSLAEKRLLAQLVGKRVGGWQIHERLGVGKSAIVFRASREGNEAALKVFDPDLVESAGRENQINRINRELSLRNKEHENLVRVFDGGECSETNFLYVVMEKIDAPNLATVLKDVPREAIRPIIAQVASAAKFLESLNPPIAHRDIKPDNIAISPDFKKAILLDLGVILPIDLHDGQPSSDEERRFFVGTLRYGPPEFLLREEKYSVDAWRAITFYQLGAVLYDLVMRERLFEAASDPYPRLVMAVEHEIPNITAKDVPEDLILLARNCLSKDPKLRLEYVKWSDFESKASTSSPAMGAKERVRRRLALALSGPVQATDERERAVLRVLQDVQGRLHRIIKAGWASSEMFCPIECHEHPTHEVEAGYVTIIIPRTPKLLLPFPLSICFRVKVVDEKAEVVEIDYIAFLSNTRPALSEVIGRHMHTVFAGAFQDGVVQVSVTDLLYRVLDLAQSSEGRPLSPEEGWIELIVQDAK